jgi:hypothetical protein
MKRPALMWSVVAIALVFHVPAGAVEMPESVVAAGGGKLTGPSYIISGSTLGQAAIGVMSGAYSHHAGFWHPAVLLTPVQEEEEVLPAEYWFGPNHPNPFNPVTTLEFSIPARGHVTMNLYDVNGRLVMTAVDEDLDRGRYQRVLDAQGISSGVYFCRMVAGRFVVTRKLVLLK